MSRAAPYAADVAGRLADPTTAGGGPFSCLECQELVLLRREHLRQGRVVLAHFFHKPGSTCAGESVLHLAAKRRLVEALSRPEHPFVIRRVCPRFGCDATHDEPWTPPAFDHAAEEVAQGVYRLDVAAVQGQSAVFGFEVYHRHRVGRIKAAGLGVPWLELQAESTARDPYVLCPVVDELITGEDEQELRRVLLATRADLPDRLAWRLAHPTLPGGYPHRNPIPTRLVDLIFRARVEGSNALRPWHCPTCAEQEAALAALQRAASERQAAEALERARDEQERQRREQEQQQQARQALSEQREHFGPGLLHPFNAHNVEFFRQVAGAFRFAVSYLGRPPRELLGHFERNSHQVLVARRCWSCNRPILCLDASGPVGEFRIYSPWVQSFRGAGTTRGHLVSKCRHCGEPQPQRDLYKGRHLTLRAASLVILLQAFQPAFQENPPSGVGCSPH